ncbi:hypothetical protein AMS68_001132 [Peltaster fructicola]|uniref:Polysaccharide export protein n=1 Tax=Peltaster fructicola TaxID=286661 RepID=A0A6H0XLV8_9PEZI|nr:hypothetical protein AMS68_001132 [Peltaster fructicola]
MFRRAEARDDSPSRKHRDANHASHWQSRRRSWIPRRLLRSALPRVLISLTLLWTVFDAHAVHHAYARGRITPPRGNLLQQRLFIASIHWNNENILRSHWNDAVLDLMQTFGRNNTFLSIQESGSWDDSKGALNDLDRMLEPGGFRRRFILDETTHLDEISKPPAPSGWIDTPRGKKELRRIPYLSRLRNIVLEPLKELAAVGEKFDKIVFLNDVIFTTRDIQVLLDTRGGHYAAACAMDFSKPPGFYDTFALRDSQGHNKLMKQWPYFRSAASRDALKANQPVPVASCWNGIAVMDAQPFYDARAPLRFRGVDDSLAKLHVEGSECCLIHADNPLSSVSGVWLNPDVRVSYNSEADRVVNPETGAWLSFNTIYWSLWRNRVLRWFTTPYFIDSIVAKRLKAWRGSSSDDIETGSVCLVNEMQVLVENGWAHV